MPSKTDMNRDLSAAERTIKLLRGQLRHAQHQRDLAHMDVARMRNVWYRRW